MKHVRCWRDLVVIAALTYAALMFLGWLFSMAISGMLTGGAPA